MSESLGERAVSLRGLVLLLGVFFTAVQIVLLPPDGWVTGDQGSKYLQTRAFATNGLLNPGIDVLSRDIDPDYRYQEPKMKERRGRLVSEFLWLLPLITAPFYRLLGLRGLYVVPALSVIAIGVCSAALARRVAGRRGIWLACIAVLATPVIVYGLEFWEHAPAAACVMAAAVLLSPDPARKGEPLRLIGAGAAIAAGALFREEVIVALPALLLARAAAFPTNRWRGLMTGGLWAVAGAAAVFAAAVPMNLLIYGAPLPMHMTQDAWDVAKSVPYLQVRRDIVWALLLPADGIPVFLTGAAAGLAAALLQLWRLRRDDTERGGDATGRALLLVVHAAVVVMVADAAILPLWRMVVIGGPGDPYRITSAAHTWIFAIALLYWPWVRDAVDRRAARFLLLSGLLIIAMAYVIVPTDGGSQWSPRFFLAAAPLLAIVAGVALFRVPMATLILIASMAMQATGAGWVKHSKKVHSQLTAWTAARAAPGDVLISDVYWFPELTATLAPTRRLLFSWRPGEMPAMAQRAVGAGFRRFRLVTSPHLTGFEPPPVLNFPGTSCPLVGTVAYLSLLVSEYSCEPVRRD